MNVSVPSKQSPIYMTRNEKREAVDDIVKARKRRVVCSSFHKSPKRRPVKPVCGNFGYPYTLFRKRNSKKVIARERSNNWKFSLMVPSTLSLQQTLELYIGTLYQQHLNFRNDQRRHVAVETPTKEVGLKTCERFWETGGKHRFKIEPEGPKSRVIRTRQWFSMLQ